MPTLKRILDPKITPREITIPDGENIEGNQSKTLYKKENFAGITYPLIKLNSTIISQYDIIDFRMSIGEDFLPIISLSFGDEQNIVHDLDYPLDGDLFSIRIRSAEGEVYEDIKLDLDIINIQKNDSIVSCELTPHLPELFIDSVESYPNQTSYQVLKSICDKLGMGFVVNTETLNDQMTYIRDTPQVEFIQEVVEGAYLDDQSFFGVGVDAYNSLNFVNLNRQFDLKEEYDQTIIIHHLAANVDSDNTNQDTQDLVLTNSPQRQGTNVYITDYYLINNTTEIWQNEGYFKELKYFKEGEQEPFIFETQTPIFSQQKDLIPTRGDLDKNTQEKNKKHKWLGVQRLDNHHPNYISAVEQNSTNLAEVQKMTLVVELLAVNLAVTLFQKIPVRIFNYGRYIKGQLTERDKAIDGGSGLDERNEQDDTNMQENNFLSGFYVVKQIEYLYNEDDQKMFQRVHLMRREFPVPPNYNRFVE